MAVNLYIGFRLIDMFQAIIAETTKIMADLEHEREELLQRAAAQQTARDSAKAKFGEQRKELLRLRVRGSCAGSAGTDIVCSVRRA